MAVVAAREKNGSRSEYCIELGILNNMPDAALARTEQQFFALLTAAAPDLLVRVRFFSLATMERDRLGRHHLDRHAYTDVSNIADYGLDALIVTGTEPRAPDLRRESYWNELARVFDWVNAEGPSTLFSCLGAHAAVLHYDGIERQRLREKCFGVFEHVIPRRDALTGNIPAPFNIAHSRWNELARKDLVACGYRILTWSAEAGVELFAKRGPCDLLFCQGHPEYDATTLAREYRRDVRRWLGGAAGAWPRLPKHYFSSAETVALEQFRARAEFARDEALMNEFPAVGRKRDSRWNAPGVAVFRAWLNRIVEDRRANPRARPVARTRATQAA